MPNPIGNFPSNATRLSFGRPGSVVQCISDTKYSQKVLGVGAVPVSTDFFTSAPSADRTVDNYDAGNQLVTSGKQFVIQGITANIISATIADVDAIVQKGILILTCQNKEIGTFRVRNLNAGGGTFVAGAQVAAANTVGVVNGLPQSDIWRIAELRIDTNQSFKAQLVVPSGVSVTTATTVEVGLHGYEVRPTA